MEFPDDVALLWSRIEGVLCHPSPIMFALAEETLASIPRHGNDIFTYHAVLLKAVDDLEQLARRIGINDFVVPR